MGRKTSSSRSSPNSNSVWRLTNRITPSWSIPTKASGTASSSFSSFIVVEDIWFPLELSWQGDDTQRHPMQYVDQGDDDPQAWPSRPSQPSQPEQHTLLVLLDDPDRQPQNNEGQKYDDQNDDSSAHRGARLGPRGKPSPARIAIDVIMTPPLNRSRRGPGGGLPIGLSPRYSPAPEQSSEAESPYPTCRTTPRQPDTTEGSPEWMLALPLRRSRSMTMKLPPSCRGR